jgi:ABC-2 type transport system permease protein
VNASLAIARLTWRRTLRGRAMWLSAAMLALPAVVAAFGRSDASRWKAAIDVLVFLLAVIPAMHLASAVADEVEDGTYTYLWSRPIPRWSVVAGKLMALTPAIALAFAASATAAYVAAHGGGAPSYASMARAVAGTTTGVAALSLLAVGMGTIVIRYAMAATIAFMLVFDMTAGTLPFAIRELSISHQVRAIATGTDEPASAALAALALGGVWFGIGLWRLRRAELAARS